MRIVVDTNVVVSALVFGGVPRKVIDLVDTGTCSLYFSPPIQAEVEGILEEKFGWSLPEIGARTRTLWSLGTQVKPEVSSLRSQMTLMTTASWSVPSPRKRTRLFSGDRHLLRLGSFQSIPVRSPRQFLDSKAWEITPP